MFFSSFCFHRGRAGKTGGGVLGLRGLRSATGDAYGDGYGNLKPRLVNAVKKLFAEARAKKAKGGDGTEEQKPKKNQKKRKAR